ncbi:anthranilate phosphoribosyltransferase [Opitutae bacterium]|nr:anthranilate phosphoribosyltransferase [Opitutae bacterium]
MENLLESTEKLKKGLSLPKIEAEEAAKILGYDSISDEEKINFLKALAIKGETAEEVSAFASVFRNLAIDPDVSDFAKHGIDVCGTGGDGFGTFNISTTVSFILAAAGVPVLKHGNRSITSKCGSADLMEAIGIKLMVDLSVHRRALEALNFTFFFAPAFHPVFKAIMPARKALASQGQKTIFNLLGPMINPAQPSHQLMGVYSRSWVEPIAAAMDDLELKSGLIVHGVPQLNSSLDELSCAGNNFFKGFGSLSDYQGELNLSDAGLDHCDPEDLKGGSVDENLSMLFDFANNDTSAIKKGLRDSIYLNAAAGLLSVAKVSTLNEGVLFGKKIVEEGELLNWLQQVKAFYSDI